MAITAITNGTVLVHVKVDFSAANKAEIDAAVASNLATYKGKTIKALDTGIYHTVSDDGTVSNGTTNVLRASSDLENGPVDLTTGRIDGPALTARLDNYDPGNIDAANIIFFDNTSGSSKGLSGIKAPSISKTLYIYNKGNNSIVLKGDNANSNVENRFFGNDFTLSKKRGVLIMYDKTINRFIVLGK